MFTWVRDASRYLRVSKDVERVERVSPYESRELGNLTVTCKI